MIEGVDYADARPSPAGLYAAGKRFVVRYGGPGRDSKQLHADELRRLQAAGLSVVANAEGSAGGFAGFAAGQAWAKSAEQHFRDLGMPGDRPIYFSVDVGSPDLAAVDAACRGAASVIGAARVGVYGGYDTIRHVATAGTAKWFWQTYAWSGGKWWPGAHLQQYRNGVMVGGGDCDLDRALTADYGQWGQASDKGERDMPLTEADKPLLFEVLQEFHARTNEGFATRMANGIGGADPAYAVLRDTASRSVITLNNTSKILAAVADLAGKDFVDESAIAAGVLAGLSQVALTGALTEALKALPKETADQVMADLSSALAHRDA